VFIVLGYALLRGLIIEGDYIYVAELGFMAVKGVSHPPGVVVAFPRLGRAAPLEEVYSFIEERVRGVLRFDDHAGQVLPQVPLAMVERHLSSLNGFRGLRPSDPLTRAALELGRLLSEVGGAQPESIGISGSILLRAHTERSDIDVVLVESERPEALEALRALRARGITSAVTADYARDLAAKRADSGLGIDAWLRHEARKLTYGVYRGVVYSAKIVKRPSAYWEPWGSARWRELGSATVRGEVLDDSHGCYTPSRLRVQVGEVVEGRPEAYSLSEICSFRSRYAEQVHAGERFEAKGRLEVDLVGGRLRLFVGNRRSDYLVSLDVTDK